jgi:small subunit ribosomal protein S5
MPNESSGGDSSRGGSSRGGSSRGGSSRGGSSRGDKSRGDKSRGDKSRGESSRGELIDKVVKIRRCAAVVKGGRRFSFTALVVVGDGRGKVGWGYGKANEVPPAVEKAKKDGSRKMMTVNMVQGSIPHIVRGRFGAAQVVLVPAGPGTGIIAGSAVRAVCEAAGISDILTKCFGSTNPHNLVKAAINALEQLRSQSDVERLRGVSLT